MKNENILDEKILFSFDTERRLSVHNCDTIKGFHIFPTRPQ